MSNSIKEKQADLRSRRNLHQSSQRRIRLQEALSRLDESTHAEVRHLAEALDEEGIKQINATFEQLEKYQAAAGDIQSLKNGISAAQKERQKFQAGGLGATLKQGMGSFAKALGFDRSGIGDSPIVKVTALLGCLDTGFKQLDMLFPTYAKGYEYMSSLDATIKDEKTKENFKKAVRKAFEPAGQAGEGIIAQMATAANIGGIPYIDKKQFVEELFKASGSTLKGLVDIAKSSGKIAADAATTIGQVAKASKDTRAKETTSGEPVKDKAGLRDRILAKK